MVKRQIKSKKIYPTPKFKSLKEEQEFWQTHSPLAEGYEGTFQKASQNKGRHSVLAVRLSGKEIGQLHDIAAKHGVGMSTLVRSLIIEAVSNENKAIKHVTAAEIAAALKKVGIVTVTTEKSPTSEKRRRVVAVH